jgi:D-alanyl-D-alanine carboxypeptidase
MTTMLAARIAILGLTVAVLGAAPASADRKAADQRLERSLTKVVDGVGGPPGAAALLRRGGNEKLITLGVADADAGKPFRRNKYMRIASASKAFSGAVALALVDDRLLSLDDTIAMRLPSLPADWGAVTLRQLLSHTGGLPDYFAAAEFQQYLNAHPQDSQVTPADLVAFVADEPLQFTPGTGFRYSNTDNVVIAMMAESATGKTYDALLKEHAFDPLGLRRTHLPADSALPRPRISGYDIQPLEDVTDCCAMAFLSASGGIYSTPHELTRFVRGYVSGELFGDPARAEQFSFIPGAGSEPPGPGRNSGGLALFRYETPCGTVFGHTGNFVGYTQFTAATRDGRRSLTVSVNRQLGPQAPGVDAAEAFTRLKRAYRLAVCAVLE